MTVGAVSSKALSLSISLVCYRSDEALLERTLSSLQRAVTHARAQQTLDVSLVLIDNGQQSKQLAALLTKCGWSENSLLIGNTENGGFARANNQAINIAQSSFHLVLNPDVELAETALLNGIRYLQAQVHVVAISPACQNSQQQNEYLCKRYPAVFDLLLRGFAPLALKARFNTRLAKYEYREQVSAAQAFSAELISGCFMLCRTSALQQVGGFNERYFLYFEDFDLSLRLGNLGELHHIPASHITHHGGGAARKGWRHIRLFVVSAIRFFNQHGWRWW